MTTVIRTNYVFKSELPRFNTLALRPTL